MGCSDIGYSSFPTRLALIDGNCFYVSCERVFRPDLIGKPVIVLSNNDGCAISRSDEAKALGVRMGDPWFKLTKQRQQGLQGFSANFGLYGDMSSRMMSVIGQFSPVQEVYSIDESFLDLTGFMDRDLLAYGQQIRARVRRDTGIPTCVGIGPTKTLAKLANHFAKKHSQYSGVCDLCALPPELVAVLFASTKVGEIWGVGRQLERKLLAMNINTVLDLRSANISMIRQQFGVVMERTVRELNGQPCISFEEAPAPRQQIVVSRSFGTEITALQDLISSVATYVARGAEKLRRQNMIAGHLQVFAHNNPFAPEDHVSTTVTVNLPAPTSDTLALTWYADKALKRLFKPGTRYKKSGIILMDLQPATIQQEGVFGPRIDTRRGELMNALDNINARFGRATVRSASAGYSAAWAMRQKNKSPAYTTDLDALPTAVTNYSE